ncbi:cytochrome-c oxidase [Paenibacillus lemnae]|uniref:Cbb3-type cytochrome c oxidase subunit I n=1 Tax=Paenibacillus lemnae TaxID=1330551 RepID=A0A848M8V9_PAELE|nr:cytochrome-c oxidase [Paenibacillus lemnae]NMO96323.1 cbb3-type cytochrome c oxidase subunit I [Paenibacillus lemnae]
MGVRLIQIAAVYFIIGVGLGMFMSMSHDFALSSVHAHVNLLGWASLGLAGVVYHLFPQAGGSTAGKIHFWLHNLGLPVMMIGLILLNSGVEGMEPVIAIGGTAVTIGIISFVYNVFAHVKSS